LTVLRRPTATDIPRTGSVARWWSITMSQTM
jgi:hypothetical protein